MRDELGPEAALADRLVRGWQTLELLPELIRRVETKLPPPGAAPPSPPLPVIATVQSRYRGAILWGAVAAGAVAGAAGALLLG